jgi:hypothetical protein
LQPRNRLPWPPAFENAKYAVYALAGAGRR